MKSQSFGITRKCYPGNFYRDGFPDVDSLQTRSDLIESGGEFYCFLSKLPDIQYLADSPANVYIVTEGKVLYYDGQVVIDLFNTGVIDLPGRVLSFEGIRFFSDIRDESPKKLTDYPEVRLHLSDAILRVRGYVCEAIFDYVRNRINGSVIDNPDRLFPADGTFIWVEETSLRGSKGNGVIAHKHWFRGRYNAGLNDRRWMEERDRKYVTRLVMGGNITPISVESSVGIGATAEPPKKSCEKAIATQRNIHSGLQYQPVIGDGNCLYRAVAYYLGHGEGVSFLRNIVAANFEHNATQYENFIPLRDGQSIQDYIAELRTTSVWAGDVEINILMKLLDRPIVIVGPDGIIRNKGSVSRYAEREPIFVSYNGGDEQGSSEPGHYDVLLLRDECSGRNILSEMLDPAYNPPVSQTFTPALNAAEISESFIAEAAKDRDLEFVVSALQYILNLGCSFSGKLILQNITVNGKIFELVRNIIFSNYALVEINLENTGLTKSQAVLLLLAFEQNKRSLVKFNLGRNAELDRDFIQQFNIKLWFRAAFLGEKNILANLHQTVDKDTVDSDGNTALHIATVNNHFEVVKYLVDSLRCDVSLRNSKNEFCVNLAQPGVLRRYFEDNCRTAPIYLYIETQLKENQKTGISLPVSLTSMFISMVSAILAVLWKDSGKNDTQAVSTYLFICTLLTGVFGVYCAAKKIGTYVPRVVGAVREGGREVGFIGEQVAIGIREAGSKFGFFNVAPQLQNVVAPGAVASGAVAPQLQNGIAPEAVGYGAFAPQLRAGAEHGAFAPQLRAGAEYGAVAPQLQNGMAPGAVAPQLQNGMAPGAVAPGAVAPQLQNGMAPGAVAPGAVAPQLQNGMAPGAARASMCVLL